MKCLKKYSWVKVPRGEIPFHGKGILIYYMRLASRAAFRKGTARYCGYTNAVEVGSWVGGMVGLKSILEVKKRRDALEIMDELQMLGYITYTLEPGTKILTYRITDWIVECSGEECPDGNVYTTPKHGFLCMPRKITERLVEKDHKFGEADAWLRSHIIGIMYDMIDFGSVTKRTIGAVLVSQTDNNRVVCLMIPEPLPGLKELTGAVEEHWTHMIHEAITKQAKIGMLLI